VDRAIARRRATLVALHDARVRAPAIDCRRHVMTDKMNPHPGTASETGRPDNWDRDAMKPDFGDDSAESPTGPDTEVPTWNEDQMARQRPDGTRTAGPSDEQIEESKGGLSGGGANAGGGERWAERDVEK
jgi:hypothetical protein